MAFYWHYTNAMGLEGILKSGHIKPSTIDVPPKELPAVWFTKSEKWDKTAAEVMIQGLEGHITSVPTTDAQAILSGGIYRFGLPACRVIPYPECRKILGLSQRRISNLNSTAKIKGVRPWDWAISKDPIAITDHEIIFEHRLNQIWNAASILDSFDILHTNLNFYLPLTREAFMGNMPDWAYKDV